MRASLCFLGEMEIERICADSGGRDVRLADRMAVRMRNGVSLLAMATVM
jgi:hypothetical protein